MFEFAQPWVLSAIILPVLIWFLIKPSYAKASEGLVLPFYSFINPLIKNPSLKNNLHRLLFFWILWTLLVMALAGPRWIGEPIPIDQEGRNIMMVLDISGSMALNDMVINDRPVSRLKVVKAAAKEFINKRQGDRVGLILFGTKAYLQTPLTYDRKTVLSQIKDATAGLAGQTTSIGDALGLAIKRLKDIPRNSRVMVLLTDGVNNSGILLPLKAADLAKNEGIKIYTIGLGGDSLTSDLDEATLRKISAKTGGQYFLATDPQSLMEIYNQINRLEPVIQDKTLLRPMKEYYAWFVGAALGMIFIFLLKPFMVNYLKWREG